MFEVDHNESRTQHDPTEQVAAFKRQLEINRDYYRDEDPANKTLSVFADAALQAFSKSHWRTLINDMFKSRPNLDPEHAVKLVERTVQSDLLAHDADYPYGYDTSVERWLEAFDAIDEDLTRWGIMFTSLHSRKVQSNISERYKSVKLLATLYQDRFGRSPTHLDVGGSAGHGSVKLAFNDSVVPFGPVEVLRSTEHLTTDKRATRLANVALRSTLEFGAMMSVDITDIDDPVIRRNIKSDSFYPDELKNRARVAEFERLETLDPDHTRVKAFRGDFVRLEFKKFLEASPVRDYDIITFSTIFYQISLEDQHAMLINASQLLSDNGIIIIQDVPDRNFSKSFNYRSWVVDPALGDNKPQEVIRWETPRCRRAVLSLGKLGLRQSGVAIGDALSERFG